MSTAEGIKFKPITAIIAPVTCGGKYFFTFSTPINLTIKDIITVEEYGKGVTAQVVGVVNMDIIGMMVLLNVSVYGMRVPVKKMLMDIGYQHKITVIHG